MVLGTGLALALAALAAGGGDPDFELYGVYGWKYEDGAPKTNRRKGRRQFKERRYIHDTSFGRGVISHLRRHYNPDSRYYDCESLRFIPAAPDSPHADAVQKLIDDSYLPQYDTDEAHDPCITAFVNHALENDRVLPWRYLHYLRTMRTRGYDAELSRTILNGHHQRVWKRELRDAEAFDALQRDCDRIVDVPGRQNDSAPSGFLLDPFLEQERQRLFLLGTHDAMDAGYYSNKNLVISPWLPIDDRFGNLGWNLTVNKTSMQCFAEGARKKGWKVPFVVKLNHEPEYYEYINFFAGKEPSESEYVGFFILRYDLDDNFQAPCQEEHLDVSEDIPHRSPANYYVMLVFLDKTRNQYKIVNFRCNIVNWGEFADAKRVTYVELHQLMCMASSYDLRFYALLQNLHRESSAQKWLRPMRQAATHLSGWILLLASFGELSPDAFRAWLPGHTLEEVTPGWDDEAKTYALFSGRHAITTQCISDPDIMSRDLVRDYHARARARGAAESGPVEFSPSPADSCPSAAELSRLADSYNEFIKSNRERMQAPEFRKRMKALAAPDESYVLSMFAHNPKKYSFNTNTGTLYRNGKPATNEFNTLSPVSFRFLRVVNQVKPGKILVVAQNIHMTELLAYVFPLAEVTLFLHNPTEIGSVVMLKRRFPSVRVYFASNDVNLILYENAVKLCAGQKFDTVVFDNGLRRSQWSHNCCTALLMALCYVSLADDGRALYYTLADRDDTGYQLLSMLHGCFAVSNSITRQMFSVHERLPMWFVYAAPIRAKLSSASAACIEILRSYTYDLEPKTPQLQDKLSREFYSYMAENYQYAQEHAEQYVKAVSNGSVGGATTGATTGHEDRVPILVDDLVACSMYKGAAMDYQPRCHWGQMKLLLSEIQFLTRVSLNADLADYALVYVGSAHGLHLPIVYELFPQLTWLLYDPAKFSKNAYEHPKGAVQIFNDFFTDKSIDHVRAHAGGRKIIFVSDIRVTPSEEDVLKDMVNQARWGVALDADFMLLKFRLPYDGSKVITSLDVPADRVHNHPKPDKGHMQYLAGDIYLQIYPPPHSSELRLYVQKRDGKYDLATYDCLSIEKKLFWYNTIVRPGWSYADSAELPEDQRGLPMRAVSMIPGFDTGVESTMEFLIVRDYLRTVGSDKDPVRELCRLDLWMQELTGRSLLTCVELTNQKSRKGKETRGKDVDERVKLWEKLYKVSLSAHQKAQRELLRKYGAEIFGDLLPKLEKQLPKDGQTFMEI
jgi:hypothetical protein